MAANVASGAPPLLVHEEAVRTEKGIVSLEEKTTRDAEEEAQEEHTEDEDDESACGNRKFFTERDQVVALLKELASTTFSTAASDVDDAFMRKHKTVTTILDRYLEQSHLLDPYLRELLAPLLTEIQRTIRSVALERQRAQDESEGVAFPHQIYRNPKLHALFQLIYCLCKVRGFKTIVKLLPHEVSDFEPTLLLLQSQDRSDHSVWETRYVLLLWLSMLCLVPFDLNTIDSSASSSLVANVLTLCKGYLADAGATQLAAAVCLARLLSRPDMETHHLERFLTWADTELCTATAMAATHQDGSSGGSSGTFTATGWRVQQFKVTGVMRCLAYLAKHSPRDKHIRASRIYFASVLQLVNALTTDDGDQVNSSTLHRKLSVKLVQRLGLLYLPPRVQSWRYQRGVRSLEMNMQRSALPATTASEPATTIVTGGTQAQTHAQEQDQEMVFDAVEELEQIVDVLLCGLRDKDTVVRWSAAKGIGRLTGRLPFEYADDVVQSVLELFVATESEGAWHGASLALAELARRGVLLPHRLTEAVDCVARALQYDIRRGAHSIGAHVRDAACYSCWSFARAYEPLLLLPHLEKTLAPAMLINCVFDRELNCRRAASAAFQENVGRQGRSNFPHGIELLTRADYFSVANIRHAFLDVSVFIAKFPEYRYALLEHLLTRKIVHWDATIRLLAAQTMGKIATLDAAHAMASVLPRLLKLALTSDVEVIVRHGATLAIAHVVRALVLAPAFVDGELQLQIKNLPLEIEKKRLFRGRGGETIRAAVCLLVQVISLAGLSLSFVNVKKYLVVLEECVVHPVESVREAAIDAFAAFTAQYCPKMFDKGTPAVRQFLAALVPRYLSSVLLKTPTGAVVLNPNVATRRGLTRAIGVAAKELLQPSLCECVRMLLRAASINQQTSDEQDAESRVAAIQALVDICSRLGDERLVLDEEELDGSGARGSVEQAVLETLVRCIHDDYGVDERGDVGSWVRKEAMLGLERLLLDQPFKMRAWERKYLNTTVSTKYGSGVIRRVLGDTSTTSDDATGGGGDEGVLCHVAFQKPALGYFYFAPQGIGLIRLSQLDVHHHNDSLDATPFMIPSAANRLSTDTTTTQSRPAPLPFCRRLAPTLTGHVVCAVVKQLAEKLDNIRVVAGSVLFHLLHSQSPRVDGIPDRFTLEKQIFPASLAINWSMAHDTFPLVVQLMDVPEYLEAVASGLVISVGGLTESVVKASKTALFDWVRAHLAAKNFGLLSRFVFFLVALLPRHAQDDRVTIPVMKTLAMLLEDGLLSFLFEKKQEHDGPNGSETHTEFGERLYAALKDEIAKTSAIPKLAAGVTVLIGLLPSEPQTETKALKALVLFLAHRFPKVRKLTAERLYTRLLVHEEVVDHDQYDDVVDILSGTAWDGPLANVRVARNELLERLGMQVPLKKPRVDDSAAEAPAKQRVDGPSADSYQSLVKEMGF